MAKVAIHILTYNGLKYLPELFASIAAQTFKNVTIRVWDNASTDGTAQWLTKHTTQYFSHASPQLSEENLSFVGAHNKMFQSVAEQYVLLVNQDTVLEKDYIEKLVEHLDENPYIASTSGLILRFDAKDNTRGTIDSAGITLKRSRKAVDLLAGEKVEKHHIQEYPAYESVFGVSGTLPIYRAAAIHSLGTLFDEDFVMYKEDVDVAYRLAKQGHQASVVNHAIAYHDRTVAQDVARKKRTYQSRYNAYRNHIWMLIKNETRAQFWPDAFHIITYELGKFFYLLCTEPATLLAWQEIISKTPNMRRKAKSNNNTSSQGGTTKRSLVHKIATLERSQ